jgi:anti-sigma regulatory factor (Ser/Thr protein kinase)
MGSFDGRQSDKRSMSSGHPGMVELGQRHFSPDAASVGEARRFVGEVLEACPAHVVQDVQLIVSELATNCVLHAKTEFTLRISASADQVLVEVGDSSRGVPLLNQHEDDHSSGRGLVITDALSTAWGVEQRGHNEKVVWAAVPARQW